MQCGTCREAKSTQLPVSEVCRQCHQYSKWCQTVPKNKGYKAVVTLYLCEGSTGRYVSTNFADNVLTGKTMTVWFDVPE